MNKLDHMGLSPAVLRSIGNIRASMNDKQVAFLLGAGFDKALNRKSPNWSKVILDIGGIKSNNGNQVYLDAITDQWPTELALLYKYHHVSKDTFYKKLNKAVNIKNNKTEEAGFMKIFSSCNLFITFNYSNLLYDILQKNCKRTNRKLRVFDREYLKTLEGEWFPKKDDVYLIHLHGRCSDRSFPILDAWGYNIVSNEDLHYTRFLKDVFTSRDVISIGVSWRDVPLRNIAAKAQLERGYAAKSHIIIDHVEDDKYKINLTSLIKRLNTDRRNAMRLAYGVDSISCTKAQRQKLLSCVASGFPQMQKLRDNFNAIADYFDSVGDFESPQQINFLASYALTAKQVDNGAEEETDRAKNVKNVADGARMLSCDIINKLSEDLITPVTAARIERHLRHHLYLYLNSNKSLRNCLWSSINKKTNTCRGFDERLRFDHAIGEFELKQEVDPKFEPGKFSGVFSERFKHACKIWDTKTSLSCKEALAHKLLSSGWEMMAAKVLGDSLQQQVLKLSKKNSVCAVDRHKTMDLADRTATIARMSGAKRRWIKADIIAAMWDADPVEARQKLLSLHHSGNIDRALEPGTFDGLLVGILVVETNIALNKNKGESVNKDVCSQLLLEIGESFDSISKAQFNYWLKLSPKLSRHELSNMDRK